MKHNKKYNIFGWLAATTLMLTTACSDNIALDVPQGDDNGTKTVTFTIQPQSQLGTRAEGDLETGNKYISDGSKADVLIFAVYKAKKDAEGNITGWEPDTEFQKGNQTNGWYEGDLGDAQNAIKVDKFPVAIQLVITDPDAEYKVAFWAQNHETKAYDTRKLHRVKVNYTDENGNPALNNDELRDAFCIVSDVITRDTKDTQTVTLRRPLAQVNIGTAGWDYEGAAHLHPSPVGYTYSKVTLGGVAQYYDILNGEALDQDALDAAIEENPNDFSEEEDADDHQATIDVTFDFNLIPAFIQADEEEWKTTYTPVEKEEFLQVDVNRNGSIDGYTKNQYVSWADYEKYRKGEINTNAADYQEPAEGDELPKTTGTEDLFKQGIMPETEVYKYLSMCYVLVPEAKTIEAEGDVAGASEGDEEDETAEPEKESRVLSFVEFEAKGIDMDETADEPAATDADDDKTLRKVFKINNVPVRKNWRTNIIGNNFFTTITKFKLDIVPEYFGDYNYNGWEYGAPDQGGSWNGEIGYTYTLSFSNSGKIESSTNFFTTQKDSDSDEKVNAVTSSFGYGIGTYNGNDYSFVKKMDAKGSISFTTKSNSTVIIVASNSYASKGGLQNASGRIDFDGTELEAERYATQPDNNKNCYIYTVNVPAGEHTISKVQDTYQFGIYYVEVKTSSFFDGETPGIFPEGGFNDKYPDYNPKEGVGNQ